MQHTGNTPAVVVAFRPDTVPDSFRFPDPEAELRKITGLGATLGADDRLNRMEMARSIVYDG